LLPFTKCKIKQKILIAATVLCNLIQSHNGDERWQENDRGNINPQSFVNLPDSDHGNDEGNMEGNNLRDMIAYHIWVDYEQRRN
jgi:hypothetical protein